MRTRTIIMPAAIKEALEHEAKKADTRLKTTTPLYMCPRDLSKYLGLGRDKIYEDLNKSLDPLPHLLVGTHKKVNRFSAEEYYRARELGKDRP